jgi:hypothetical protein
MKNSVVTWGPSGTGFSAEESEKPCAQSIPRRRMRGFFSRFQRVESREDGEIVWSLPPILPFENEEPYENSGFVARAGIRS